MVRKSVFELRLGMVVITIDKYGPAAKVHGGKFQLKDEADDVEVQLTVGDTMAIVNTGD